MFPAPALPATAAKRPESWAPLQLWEVVCVVARCVVVRCVDDAPQSLGRAAAQNNAMTTVSFMVFLRLRLAGMSPPVFGCRRRRASYSAADARGRDGAPAASAVERARPPWRYPASR